MPRSLHRWIELVLAGGLAFAQAEQAVGELLAIVGQYRADVPWAGAFEVAQEASRICGGPGFVDADEHPGGARSIATKRYRREDSSAI
jgi:hypothetical protein